MNSCAERTEIRIFRQPWALECLSVRIARIGIRNGVDGSTSVKPTQSGTLKISQVAHAFSHEN